MDRGLTLQERTRIAFKKLKASVYFDKTQLPLRDELVEFEESAKVDDLIDDLAINLEATEKDWNEYQKRIIGKINTHVFPKKLSNGDNDERKPVIIFNTDSEPITLKEAQYFLDMPVTGHILGALWVLSVGIEMDDRRDPEKQLMYEYSYGNRLRKNLINPESGDITYSPGLFEPYFSQYESWRDKALEYAKNRLDDKQDALILSMDFKSFFYSVNIPKRTFNEILNEEPEKPWKKRLHEFVYKVLRKYSEILNQKNKDLGIGTRTILPIGYLPSNILSNWILTPFDNAIVKRWNPVYYGRYVDDIIIVDKVEKNSPLRKGQLGKASLKLSAEDVIKYYFSACPVTRDLSKECKEGQPLLYHEESQFRVNPEIFYHDSPNGIKSNLLVQNDKVKVFYFREGATRALLDCFRTQIAQNASEFRYLPDMDMVLTENNYSEIFCLSNDDSIHKLRGVTGVKLNKFSLSKFLGKYRKVGGMIRDKKENAFDKDLLTVMDKRVLIENYTLWERLLEIMLVNDRLKNYEKLVVKIFESINDLNGNERYEDSKYALLKTLRAAIARTTALRWGLGMKGLLKAIEEAAAKRLSLKDDEFVNIFSEKTLIDLRGKYLRTRMVNKYIMPLLVDYIRLKDCIVEEDHESTDICLNKLEDVMKYIEQDPPSYRYYPYIIPPQDLSFAIACCDISSSRIMENPEVQKVLVENRYREWNYPNREEHVSALDKVDVLKFKDDHDIKLPADDFDVNVMSSYAISVSNGTANKLRVAIGNARLHDKDFLLALTGRPNRSYDRYNQLSKLFRLALEESVELLVLPENYLPWEWIPDVARLCANNQMALVTGVEHIISTERTVYNLTAVILPYRQNDYKYSHVVYHQKTHFAPEEKRLIQGYRMKPNIGNTFHLFCWRDVWFSVYCCFELASIRERSLFKSLADLTVAVEWNRDITYFSSIIESLCRDLHCYCIQANSSDYGDSRVISPSRTEKRDLVKTKGGKNSTILVEDIDIRALREFQLKEYELQKQDDAFKPTPPDFRPEIVEIKLAGTLWKQLVMASKVKK